MGSQCNKHRHGCPRGKIGLNFGVRNVHQVTAQNGGKEFTEYPYHGSTVTQDDALGDRNNTGNCADNQGSNQAPIILLVIQVGH